MTGTFQNPATATYLDPTRTVVAGTTSSSYDPASSTAEDIQVLPALNNFPHAGDDSYTFPVNSPTQTLNVLTNDNFGLDGPSIADITIVTLPTHGTGAVDDGGTPTNPTDDAIFYTPQPGYTGPDSLVYQICDASLPPDCATATVNINVMAPPSISKAFSPNPIGPPWTTTLTFTIVNPNAGAALTGVAFSDPLPTNITVATPPNEVITNCGVPVFVPAAGAASITFSDGTIPAGGTCTVSVDVTPSTAGIYDNTSSAVTSTNGGTGNTASATLRVLAPPSISKTFSSSTMPTNGLATLTFTITNPNTGDILNGIAFSDSFPSGMVVASPTGAGTSGCGTPTYSPTVGASSITFSNGTIVAGSTCMVTIQLTATSRGVDYNSSSTVSSTNGGTGNFASAVITVLDPVQISKAFGTNPVAAGTATTLTFTLINPNATMALTGVAFTDTFPPAWWLQTRPTLSPRTAASLAIHRCPAVVPFLLQVERYWR